MAEEKGSEPDLDPGPEEKCPDPGPDPGTEEKCPDPGPGPEEKGLDPGPNPDPIGESMPFLKNNLGLFGSVRSERKGSLCNFTKTEIIVQCVDNDRQLERCLRDEDSCEDNLGWESIETCDDNRNSLDVLIQGYNRRNWTQTFPIQLLNTEVEGHAAFEYEGALRFYYNHKEQGKDCIKAIKIRNSDTVEDIGTILIEKFKLEKWELTGGDIEIAIFLCLKEGERQLGKKDKPLELALHAETPPRFIAREVTLDQAELINNTDREENSDHSVQLNDGNDNEAIYRTVSEIDYAEIIRKTSKKFSSAGKANDPNSKQLPSYTQTQELRRNCSFSKEVHFKSGTCISWDLSPKCDSDSDSELEMGLDKKNNPQQENGAILSNSFTHGQLMNSNSKKKKRRERDTSLDRTTRSRSKTLQKRLSFHKKDHSVDAQTELSTVESAPGVLKVFGSSIIPGAEYKSVLAIPSSTAQELVKESLERYDIPREDEHAYVLCDVIGESNKQGKQKWTEHCMRVIGDHESPLELQSFWKPKEGLSRRFELRNRLDVTTSKGQDTKTCGINANARKFSISKSCKDISPNSTVFLNDSNLSNETTPRKTVAISRTISFKRQGLAGESYSYIHPPTVEPYLVTLKSLDNSKEFVLYSLSREVTLIGCNNLESQDMSLCAPDILPQHCKLSKYPIDNGDHISGNGTAFHPEITVEPYPDASVRINGHLLTEASTIHPGDTLSIGDCYTFLYRHPEHPSAFNEKLSSISDIAISSPMPNNRVEHDSENPHHHHHPQCTPSPTHAYGCTTDQEPMAVLEWRRSINTAYEHDQTRLKLSFSKHTIDAILEKAVQLMDMNYTGFELTPAYLLAMVMEYAAAKHDQNYVQELFSKIAAMVKTAVMERTKVLAEEQQQSPEPFNGTMDNILPLLRPLILWVSNSAELVHYFNVNSANLLMDPTPVSSSGHQRDINTDFACAMEEIVLYTFQQVVYYLTKSLYPVLHAVLDGNPFSVEDSNGLRPLEATVEIVISIYEAAYDLAKSSRMNPRILSQLFCYLFFFTSTSLFNSLMRKGAGEIYFKWSKGAQLRGNLDAIESWASEKELQQEAMTYLQRLSSVADLLATPKVHLLQATWKSLSCDYPILNSTQLQQILNEYQLGRNVQRPSFWIPNQSEAAKINEDELLASFNEHPPLVIPRDYYQMDLGREIPSARFYETLADIQSTAGLNEVSDDGDSGLSVSQNISLNKRQNYHPYSPLYHARPPAMFEDKGNKLDPEGTSSNNSSGIGTDTYDNSQLNSGLCTCPKEDHSTRRSSFGRALSGDREGHKDLQLDNIPNFPKKFSSHFSMEINDASSGNESPNMKYSPYAMSRLKDSDTQEYQTANQNIYRPTPMYPDSKPTHERGRTRSRNRPEEYDIDTGLKSPQRGTSSQYSIDYGVQKPVNRSSSRNRSPRSSSYDRTNQKPSISNNRLGKSQESVYENLPIQNRLKSSSNVKTSPWTSNRNFSKSQDDALTNSWPEKQFGDDKYSTVKRQTSINIPPEPEKPAPLYNSHLRTFTRQERPPDVPPLNLDSPNYKLPHPENYVEVCNSSQSQNSTHTGLRVLPLCSDDNVERNTVDLVKTLKSPHQNPSSSGDIFKIVLTKGDHGLGLGLIDGMYTPLKRSGIYVRTLVPGAPAAIDGRLQLGDQILKVNGTSIVGSNYQDAMTLIRNGGKSLDFLVSKGNPQMALQVTASTC